MTPTAQYPRSRYVAMQVALFLVLLGTVALANWVSHRHVAVVDHVEPIVLGDFTLLMPPDWTLAQKQNKNAIEITAVEPGETGRQVSALFQQMSGPMLPMDYLTRSNLVTGAWSGQQMTVDGYPGAYIEMMRLIDNHGQRLLAKDLLACIVLPNGQVLTLQLTGTGRVDENDHQLIQEILTRLQIKAQKSSASRPAPQQQEWEGI